MHQQVSICSNENWAHQNTQWLLIFKPWHNQKWMGGCALGFVLQGNKIEMTLPAFSYKIYLHEILFQSCAWEAFLLDKLKNKECNSSWSSFQDKFVCLWNKIQCQSNSKWTHGLCSNKTRNNLKHLIFVFWITKPIQLQHYQPRDS